MPSVKFNIINVDFGFGIAPDNFEAVVSPFYIIAVAIGTSCIHGIAAASRLCRIKPNADGAWLRIDVIFQVPYFQVLSRQPAQRAALFD